MEENILNESEQERLDYINNEFTNNKLTTKYLFDFLAKEEKRKVQLESRVRELTNVTKVKIRKDVHELEESIKSLQSQTAVLRTQIAQAVKENLPDRVEDAEIYTKMEEIDDLEKSRDYVLVIHFVMHTSTKISAYLQERNLSDAITMFNQLRSLCDIVLLNSEASNLSKYCSGVLETWEAELHETVGSELSSSLETIGWPSRIDTTNPTEEILSNFQSTVRSFAELTHTRNLPSKKSESTTIPLILSSFRELSPLVQLLLRPIGKRFRYHFHSSKATADDTKPEWYFAQVKQWMRDLVPFLATYVEAIQQDVSGTSVIVEFLLGLSQLLILKTDSVLCSSAVANDDVIFSKILEESGRFESNLKIVLEDNNLTGKEELPGFISTIFSQPQVLDRWISIEKRGSLEKLDTLFSSSTAWSRVVVPGPTEISELFITMVRFIIDRFACLRQPGQKIQFVQLVIEILEDFRLRCLQIWKSGSTNVDNLEFLVAETLGYVHKILQEWEETPFFETLNFFWNSIRAVEKEDLEQRRRRRISELITQSDESDVDDTPRPNGVFHQVRAGYASSMEMVLISISQK